MQVDAVDETRVDDRRARASMKQVRDLDAVDEVPNVSRRGSADVKERKTRHDRRHTGERLDGAKRVPESARQLADFRPAQGDRSGIAPATAHAHVFWRRRSGNGNGRLSTWRCVLRGRGWLRLLRRLRSHDTRRHKSNFKSNARSDRSATSLRRREAPGCNGRSRRRRKRFPAARDLGIRNRTGNLHGHREFNNLVSLGPVGIGYRRRIKESRRFHRLSGRLTAGGG